MYPTGVSGIVNGIAPVSLLANVFPFPRESPRSLCERNIHKVHNRPKL